MRAHVITLPSDERSVRSVERLLESHQRVGNSFDIRRELATTPDMVDAFMASEGLTWTYPWDSIRYDTSTGLRLHPYRTRVRAARIACFISHYKLWQQACADEEWLIVLEDDAEFTQRVDLAKMPYQDWGAVGLCDPRGATRRADVFHAKVQDARATHMITAAPRVDELEIPQGLAGHSAYMVSPWLAKALIEKAHAIGCWPNDALMCQQLFPLLGVTTTYYTRVQGRTSNLA